MSNLGAGADISKRQRACCYAAANERMLKARKVMSRFLHAHASSAPTCIICATCNQTCIRTAGSISGVCGDSHRIHAVASAVIIVAGCRRSPCDIAVCTQAAVPDVADQGGPPCAERCRTIYCTFRSCSPVPDSMQLQRCHAGRTADPQHSRAGGICSRECCTARNTARLEYAGPAVLQQHSQPRLCQGCSQGQARYGPGLP